MGCPSMTTHRGLVHWQVLLLVVSLLNFWSLPTTALMTVESEDAVEGMNAILRVNSWPRNAEQFLWFRGRALDTSNNIAYLSVNSGNYIRGPPGGKLTVGTDGSLAFKNVTIKDSGVYTVMARLQGCQKLVACGSLNVYRRVSVPTLLASRTIARENKDAVVFSCSTNHDSIEWFFRRKSLILTDRMKLSYDHRNLTIDPVLRGDAGVYECKASNPKSGAKSGRLRLKVKTN